MTIKNKQAAQAEAECRAYELGLQHAELRLKESRAALQLETMRAITTLIQESSKMMSRAGYLLGKANPDAPSKW
jgi:hypothetical protein